MIIQDLWESFYGDSCGSQGTVVSAEPSKKQKAATSFEPSPEPSSKAIQIDLDRDVETLESVFGPFEEGKVIEVSLGRLLELCPRNRRKTDAFTTLRNRLRAYGTELRVVPNSRIQK